VKSLCCLLILCASSLVSQSDVKPHYFYSGAGYTFPKFPEPLHSRVQFIEIMPGVSHIPVSVQPIGYYRSRGDRLLWGGVVQVDLDRFSLGDRSLQIEQYQSSFSFFYFLEKKIASGLFIRGDFGPAVLRLSSGDQGMEKLSVGWGLLIAGGSAFKIRSQPILSSIHYAYKSIHGKKYSLFSIGFGLLY